MKKGFTLIELLIVMAIIGILAAVALPAFRAHQQNGGELSYVGGFEQHFISTDPSYVPGSMMASCNDVDGAIRCSGTAEFKLTTGIVRMPVVGACDYFANCQRY